MRPCPVCGTLAVETDEFCGNCGSYLGWSQSAAGESTVDQPKPVQPATPIAPQPTRDTVVEPKVDGPPCPNCGTANPPGRRYCRRCAYPLSAPEQAAPPRRHRFGRRQDGSGRLARALVLLAIVVALVVAGFALRPQIEWLVQDVLDKTSSQPAPVHPVNKTASAAAPGHPAGDAVDGVTNHYWGAPGPGAWIEFSFDHPFRLVSLIITTGASPQQDQFAAQGRPTQFDVTVTTSDGMETTLSEPLADQPGPQPKQTGISDVVKIRMVILAVAGLQPGRVAALGEVEFFQRS
jgi:hypothetical protein